MVQFINEVWKPLEINPVYLVSNQGRIKTIDHLIWCKVNNSYSLRKGHICTLSNKNSKKYWRVGIQINGKRKQYAVHRLVALTFIPNPNSYPQINHIDGNKDNNAVDNLEWCDGSYNIRHAHANGLISKKKMSDHCHLRKLTEEQVIFIRQMYNKYSKILKTSKQYCRAIIQLFNLKSENTVHWILTKGTNKFINQDIVQTTNFNDWETQLQELLQKNVPAKSKSAWARELGVPISSFITKYTKLDKDLTATIEYYHNKANENQSGKESSKA